MTPKTSSFKLGNETYGTLKVMEVIAIKLYSIAV
ncbi:hypothetical protein BCE_4615 [Bacillus cereus ATCC 10987]|uniref:Uncharacterized protein n=1 Tax=Bacillus cereus (strain ATCC 10987 / NRS 248) TaxID=222523 RepID=Q72ZQ3_BACC1|nr:hypothetical protein BCE_4615 [Bacillus cereus ATCC 10987]